MFPKLVHCSALFCLVIAGKQSGNILLTEFHDVRLMMSC